MNIYFRIVHYDPYAYQSIESRTPNFKQDCLVISYNHQHHNIKWSCLPPTSGRIDRSNWDPHMGYSHSQSRSLFQVSPEVPAFQLTCRPGDLETGESLKQASSRRQDAHHSACPSIDVNGREVRPQYWIL